MRRTLNSNQQRAVDRIEGPLLVLAGPGTGKTELLSARVANILTKTDVMPGNILCVTFTEAGQTNMLRRLIDFIGQDAYKVHIHTYHSLGSRIITENPEYFSDRDLDSPIDNITSHNIIQGIHDRLAHRDPLKKNTILDITTTIKECKENLLSAQDLETIADTNEQEALKFNAVIQKHLPPSTIRSHKIAFEVYSKIQAEITPLSTPDYIVAGAQSETYLATVALGRAFKSYAELSKPSTKPFTAWRNNFLKKDRKDNFILKSDYANRKLRSLASVLRDYETTLAEQKLFDYTDMILESIRAISEHDDLRFTLQERYQFILLDEYQDTNPAQLQLINLLTDNPVHEGRPNIMAVGDDDQAIYTFQGAEYKIFGDFVKTYHCTSDDIIFLTENYRSSSKIIDLSSQIRAQLGKSYSVDADLDKNLIAQNDTDDTSISHLEFNNFMSEFDFVAQTISDIIQREAKHSRPQNQNPVLDPNLIGVLAPKHKYLLQLAPYLKKYGIAINYEKKENILETDIIQQILTTARLLIALNEQQPSAYLWPAVLSAPYYQIDPIEIWRFTFSAREAHQSWHEFACSTADFPTITTAVKQLLTLALQVKTTPLEKILDRIIGSDPITPSTNATTSKTITHSTDITAPKTATPSNYSPLRSYYESLSDADFFTALSHLSTLRQKIRARATSSTERLYLADLVKLATDYTEAGEKIISSLSISESKACVNLMSAHQSKGLEFKYVFLISSDDHAWSNSKGNNNRLTLPLNLEYVRHTSATDDDKLRLLFVAITRARQHLYITSSQFDIDDAERIPLRYYADILPISSQNHPTPTIADLERSWHFRHLPTTATMRDFLTDIIDRYAMSPTHLNNYTDLEYSGPPNFLTQNLLRFPEAPSSHSIFGTSIHSALKTAQVEHLTDPKLVNQLFISSLKSQSAHLSDDDFKQLSDRGIFALTTYLGERAEIFMLDHVEVEYHTPIITFQDTRLKGVIDRIEINQADKTITVVDYKTGASHSKFTPISNTKDHNAEIQLYFYKLLLENDEKFRNYTITHGRIEFVEPDTEDVINVSTITFNPARYQEIKQLICAVWSRVQNLDFAHPTAYKPTIQGTRAFEQDLIGSLPKHPTLERKIQG